MAQRIPTEGSVLKEARIAPFTLLRVACLPIDTLQSFVAPALSLSLEKYIKEQNQLRETGQELVETLERLVPQADTNELRNRLIQLKRDIHNQRSCVLEDDIREWLERRAAWTMMKCWLELQQKAAQSLKCLTSEADHAFDIIDTTLVQCWDNPFFRQGVSIASPSLSTRVTPDWRSFKQKKRRGITSSLFAYATRAAAKTSPFSTFTSTCVLPLDIFDGRSAVTAGKIEILAKSKINPSIPTALRNVLLARCARELPIFFHLNPHIMIAGNKIVGVGHRYVARMGIVWLEQNPILLNLPPDIAEMLRQLPACFRWTELEDSLGKLDIEAGTATQLINELFRKDIIRSQLEWGADCDNPMLFLVDQLNQCPADVVGNFRDTLSSMEMIAQSFSTASTADRVRSIQQINTLYTDLHGKFCPHSPPEIHSPIGENSWIRGIDFRAGSGFIKLFQRLGKAVNERMSISNSYIYLRNKFIEQYGEGGVCNNIPQFVTTVWSKAEELLPGEGAKSVLKAMEAEPDRFGGIAREHVVVPITAFVQIIAQNLDELERAEPKIVINHLFHRVGWQTVRWCNPGNELAEPFQDQIKSWLREAAAPRTPISVTVSPESSSLQAHLRCTDHMLVVDGAVSAKDLKLSDLLLKHNRQSNLLELTTQNHILIQPNYLGALIPSPSFGPRFLAIVLGEPFKVFRPSLYPGAKPDDRKVIYEERVEQYGCVFLRATWRVNSGELLRRLDKTSSVAGLIAVQDFRDEFGIPRLVYAKGQASSLTTDRLGKARKPVWVDFHNVACLDQLFGMAKGCDWIALTEVLPGPGEHVLKIQGQEYTSEFIFEAVFSGTRNKEKG